MQCFQLIQSHSHFINIKYKMKEQRQDDPVEQQQPQLPQIKQLPKKIEHPEEQYSVSQLFSIRKQSSNMANDQIYKKLTKSFHRIKKLRSQPNGIALIQKEFDYESNPIRLTFKRAHDLYNQTTKTHQIVKRKIDKMRGKVDRIKSEIETSELSMISEVDINKIYARGGTQNTASQNVSNNQQQVSNGSRSK